MLDAPESTPDENEFALIRMGGEVVKINTATGEIIELPDAPGTQFAHEIAEYVGPLLAKATAALEGAEAERAAYMKRGADLFDAEIKQRQRWVEYLKGYGSDTLRDYAERATDEKTRTVRLGLLRLSFRKNPASTKVVDKAASVEWARKYCPKAIKTEESVLVSAIPDDLKAGLRPDSGLAYYPAYDKFEVK